jgi:hypothetical protein
MARPRMFVSSTYYDLKYVRADICEFADQFGIDAVLFEKEGMSPTNQTKNLRNLAIARSNIAT